MAPFSTLLTAVLALSSAEDTEDRLVRVYDVRDLASVPSMSLGVEMQPGTEHGDELRGFSDALRSPGKFLVDMVLKVAQLSDASARSETAGNDTAIRLEATPTAHAAVERCISGLRKRLHRHVVMVEGNSFPVADGDMGELRELLLAEKLELGSEASLSVFTIDKGGKADRRLQELAGRDEARTLPRLSVAPLQAWDFSDAKVVRYVKDFERVEVLDGSEVLVPVIEEMLADGLQFRGRAVALPQAEGDELLGIDLQLLMREMKRPVQSFETPHGRVHMPEAHQWGAYSALMLPQGAQLCLTVPAPRGGGRHHVVTLSFRSRDLAPEEATPSEVSTTGVPLPTVQPGEVIPSIDAVVADVGTGFVVLSAGESDGVKIGYPFDVYRGGTYIGRVVVNRVYPDNCIARIQMKDDDEEIKTNDKASTRL